MSRYTDAYVIARTISTVGTTVKSIGLGTGLCVAVAGLLVGSQSVQYAVAGVVLGVIVAVPLYVLGILVSAQGQILKATLDSAVNSSPLLAKEQVREILSLD